MPELPDVENVINSVRPGIVGRQVEAVVVLDPTVLANTNHETLDGVLSGHSISRVSRRGKYIVISLNEHYALLIHLRMTGDLRLTEPPNVPRYTRMFLDLEQERRLAFTDPRRLGRVHLVMGANPHAVPPLSELGPEPLETDRDEFRRLLKRHRMRIKALLLNQRIIVGVGNLYADEILWRAGIAPGRISSSLSDAEIDRIYDAMRESLSTGTGIFFPHRTEGKCVRCGTELTRSVVGGRTTYHCPACQS